MMGTENETLDKPTLTEGERALGLLNLITSEIKIVNDHDAQVGARNDARNRLGEHGPLAVQRAQALAVLELASQQRRSADALESIAASLTRIVKFCDGIGVDYHGNLHVTVVQG